MSSRVSITASLAAVLLFLAFSSAPARSLELPARFFFREPFLSHVEISPSGKYLAGLIVRGDKETLIVRETGGSKLVPIARNEDPGWRISNLEWATDERLVFAMSSRLYRRDSVGLRSTRLFGVNRDGSEHRYLGKKWPYQPAPQFRSGIMNLLRKDPEHILINYRTALGGGVTPREADIASGELGPELAAHPRIERWYSDRFGNTRAGSAGHRRSTKYRFFARIQPKGRLILVSEFDPYTEAGLFFAAFAEAPEILYVIKHEPRGRTSVHEYDLAKGELGKEVFSHPEVDAVGIVFDHEGRAVGVDYILEGYERHFFDEAAAREQRGLDQALPSGSSRIVSSSWNGKLKVVMASGSDSPPRYYLLDREEKDLSVLFSAYPELDSVPLSKTRPVSFEARDGLSLHAYVTVPASVPEQGLPALVLVQDGPERQDWLGFSPIVQFLANRGFAVLVVNFRGTFGYGEAFEAAGREQWGLAIQDDLEDGVRWLIAEGIADPRRVGILGSGFGGYSALMGAVRTPTLYRACASFGAATDLVTLVREKQHDGLWTHDVEGFAGVWSDRERLVATSPYDQIEKIEVPILLGHGERDARVHVKHATRMHAGLQHAGKDSELRLYELESSWLRHEENRSDFYERVARFFEQHLAPHTPPEGSALQPD